MVVTKEQNGEGTVNEVKGLELRQLKTFMAIVKLGNFSQAAQFLGYTQSTVTTHVQLLEKALNTVLFERFGHQLMLTSDGERLYDYADHIVKLTEDAKNELDRVETPHGSFILGLPEVLSQCYFTGIIQEYMELYPEVNIKVQFVSEHEARNLLRKNMMDGAVMLEHAVKDTEFVSSLLWEEPLALLASPTHSLARQALVSWQDLHRQVLCLTSGGGFYQSRLLEAAAKAGVAFRSVVELGQSSMTKHMVIAGLGLAVLPLAAVQTECQAGTLVPLPWQGLELTGSTYFVQHKEKWLSPAIKAFRKLVRERLCK